MICGLNYTNQVLSVYVGKKTYFLGVFFLNWIYKNLDGDSLTIHDEGKRKKRYHNLCGVEKPLPIKMKKKSRVKNIIFKTKGGNIGYGFGMYLTVLGCV